MVLARVVLPEALDGLAAHDPAARRSRRDLQRVHRAMGTASILLRALRRMATGGKHSSAAAPFRVLELGAGDGTLMLGVARALQGQWPAVSLTLLDRQRLLDASTIADYAAVGWAATAQVADVLDWAAEDDAPASASRWDLVVANLFLHHFDVQPLTGVLAAVAARSQHFLACEPRRGLFAWAGSQLVGALGANAVTRGDAVLSVHAGFRGHELRSLWPAGDAGWTLDEYPAGLFSHCLTASRAAERCAVKAAP